MLLALTLSQAFGTVFSMMMVKIYYITKWVFFALFFSGLPTAYGDVYNEIIAVSPNSAAQGITGLVVTFTLDTDEPPAPPAGVIPQSVTIGSINGTSVTHSSQYELTAVFDIPAGETIGAKDMSIIFETPVDTLEYSMPGGFTVTEGADTPPSITGQPQSKTVMPDNSVTFTVTASGTSPLSWQWQKDTNDITDANSSSYTIESTAYSDQGDYRCIITNDYGSATSDTATLIVDENAYSGTYPIVDTGQVECYDDSVAITVPAQGEAYYGQDAQFNGNQPSYTLSGDGLTVTDNVTGLIWTQTANIDGDGDIDVDDKLSVTEALAHPDTLNAQNYGGYNDWRLPTIKELYSLMNFTGEDPSSYTGTDTSGLIPFIDTDYFDFGYGDTNAGERIIDAQWASSTLYVSTTMGGNETMFGLNLADGRIKGYPTTNKTYYVYFVHGNTDYGVNNFVDNSDGTISDKTTGLMWARDDSLAGLNWEEALGWVQTKNTENYLGYGDWRLPNVKELQSIVDYTRSPDTTSSAAIDQVFNTTSITNEASQVDYPCYWSGTTHARSTVTDSGSAGAYVAFGRAMGYWNNTWQDVHGAGAQRSDPKSGDPADWPTGRGPQGDAIRIYNYVRLVRNVQCGEPGYVSDLNGDLNADCYVDFLDFAKLGQGWQTTYEMSDLEILAQNWLGCIDPDAPCNYL